MQEEEEEEKEVSPAAHLVIEDRPKSRS